MALTINTNVSALTAQRNLGTAANRSASSLSKLSSGSRVPTAKEDAASLSIGTGLKLDVAAFRAAQTNAQQATSLLQVADGAFSQIGDILARMKTLATTAQSDQLSDTERGFLDTEFTQLENEINRIASTVEFNGVQLLNLTGDLEVTGLSGTTNLSAANGVVGFEFDAAKVTAAENFEFAFSDGGAGAGTTHTLILTNQTTNVTQSISVVTDANDEIVADGGSLDVNFDKLGVTLTLNDQFGDAGTGYAIGGGNVNIPFASGADDEFTSQVSTAAPSATLNFQVGIGATANDEIGYTLQGGTVNDLVGAGFTGVASAAGADTTTAEVDTAVEAVNTARATIGATLNRLEFASSNLAVSIENVEAARSVLLDVDVSAEITKFTSEQVLIQAGVSLLAQANQQPGLLLRLLQ